MQDIIAQLRAIGYPFNPPATPEQLRFLENKLNCTLDPALIELYRDHNGAADSRKFAFSMRLLSIDEVVETHEAVGKMQWPTHDFRLFWTDDNSNYTGVYVSGLLKGKLCFLNHEEEDLSPVFRSIGSFYELGLRAAAADQDWYEMAADYPTLAASPHDEADRKLALQFITQFESLNYEDYPDDPFRQYPAYCALRLLPMNEIERIISFVHDRDMWIQARACEVLGMRRYLSAMPLLAEVARSGMHNGQTAAIAALGRLGDTPEARALLLKVARQLKPGFHRMFALEKCGFEVKRDGDTLYYREPGSTEWRLLE